MRKKTLVAIPGLHGSWVSWMVICGADDKICPPDLSREIADGISGARLALLERCGHFILYEQASNWLTNSERGSTCEISLRTKT